MTLTVASQHLLCFVCSDFGKDELQVSCKQFDSGLKPGGLPAVIDCNTQHACHALDSDMKCIHGQQQHRCMDS